MVVTIGFEFFDSFETMTTMMMTMMAVMLTMMLMMTKTTMKMTMPLLSFSSSSPLLLLVLLCLHYHLPSFSPSSSCPRPPLVLSTFPLLLGVHRKAPAAPMTPGPPFDYFQRVCEFKSDKHYSISLLT